MPAVDICRNCGGSGYTTRPSGRVGRCVYCLGRGYVEIDSPETDPQPPTGGRCLPLLITIIGASATLIAGAWQLWQT